MASLQQYLEKMSDEELRGILRSYCNGTVDIALDGAFMICVILARRNPQLPNPKALFRSLCREYCKENTL